MKKEKRHYTITFAGAVGTSKTPIATYLSYNLSLPIFSSDPIRSEVTEDMGQFDNDEYLKRRNTRLQNTLKSGKSFIYDASIDREWPKLNEKLRKFNYTWFVISLNLSKEFIRGLYEAKGYNESLKRLDSLIKDHDNFLKYHHEIDLEITDANFKNRLNLSLHAAEKFTRQLRSDKLPEAA